MDLPDFSESDNNWAAGATTAVAWDHVTEYTVFESVEDYERRIDSLRGARSLQ